MHLKCMPVGTHSQNADDKLEFVLDNCKIHTGSIDCTDYYSSTRKLGLLRRMHPGSADCTDAYSLKPELQLLRTA